MPLEFGLIAVSLVIFQALSAVRFQKQESSEEIMEAGEKNSDYKSLRSTHRWIGRVAFVIWTSVVLLGAFFTLFSNKINKLPKQQRDFTVYAVFLYIGVATFVNMVIGIVAAASNKWRDLVLHKACMFFAMNWWNSRIGAIFSLVTLLNCLKP